MLQGHGRRLARDAVRAQRTQEGGRRAALASRGAKRDAEALGGEWSQWPGAVAAPCSELAEQGSERCSSVHAYP